MDEGSRLRGHEGYGVCIDEVGCGKGFQRENPSEGFSLGAFLLTARHRFLCACKENGVEKKSLRDGKESGPAEHVLP